METVISNINLGEFNKLILYPIPDEKLLAVAIVNAIDNNNLISRVLKDFMRGFINLYSPDYKLETIEQSRVDNFLEISLKGKIIINPLLCFLLSLFIILPFSLGLLFLSVYAAEYLFYIIIDNTALYMVEDIFFEILPIVSLLIYIIILILFPITNFISGYVTANYKILIFNIFVQLAFVNVIYFLVYQELLWFAVLINLPMVCVVAVLFSYIGFKTVGKRKMFKD